MKDGTRVSAGYTSMRFSISKYVPEREKICKRSVWSRRRREDGNRLFDESANCFDPNQWALCHSLSSLFEGYLYERCYSFLFDFAHSNDPWFCVMKVMSSSGRVTRDLVSPFFDEKNTFASLVLRLEKFIRLCFQEGSDDSWWSFVRRLALAHAG